MGSSSVVFKGLVAVLLMLSIAHSGLAQNDPWDWVDLHNEERTRHGIEPVSWDEEVAAFAETYAQQMASDCSVFEHSNTELYGENLFMAGNTDATASDAVNNWLKERTNFDFNERKCHDINRCGHFAQIVWRTSTAIGCARAVCEAGKVGAVFTCNYSPPGNYPGEPAF